MKTELALTTIFWLALVISVVSCAEELSTLQSENQAQFSSKKGDKDVLNTKVTQVETSTKSVPFTRKSDTSEKNNSLLTTDETVDTSDKLQDNSNVISTIPDGLPDVSQERKNNNIETSSSFQNSIVKHDPILREKNNYTRFNLPLYTLIVASTAVAMAALCITVVVIWKASKRRTPKSRLSNLDQKNLNNVELCVTKKELQDNLKFSFAGIPPNGEIWREIKSSTPTVF